MLRKAQTADEKTQKLLLTLHVVCAASALSGKNIGVTRTDRPTGQVVFAFIYTFLSIVGNGCCYGLISEFLDVTLHGMEGTAGPQLIENCKK